MLENRLKIEYKHSKDLKAYKYKLRKHEKNQVQKAQRLIEECGFVIPILIDQNNCIITGHYMVDAAIIMGIKNIPVIYMMGLTDEQIRILRIAHDRVAEDGKWDKIELAKELQELELLIPDLTITGFELDEINLTLDIIVDNSDSHTPNHENSTAVTQVGDLWILGDHKIYCGDALKGASYKSLLINETADLCFTDPPYNVKIDGHVGNSGKTKHREFSMASGEMNEDEFTSFLTKSHQYIAKYMKDGGIVFSCMDWRHMQEMLSATKTAKLNLQNLCVWVKDNGGMGSLYRSRHELVFVLKNGKAKHLNNVELGKNGRYRTNVWEYPGINSFGGSRMEELSLHPTVKPVQMVEDSIKDCSKRGQIILDPFGGSGTTLIAAENTKRKGRLIELDPLYCDTIIRRWEKLTNNKAIHADSGETFKIIEGSKISHE